MDFKRKLKTRLNIAIAYMVLGVIMIVSTFITKTDNYFISSFGFPLTLIGLVRVRNYFIISKNEETIKKREIAETDERNVLIMRKAKSDAFNIYVLLLGVTVIALSFLNLHDIAKWISYSVCLLVIIYWICYWIHYKRT